MDTVIVTGGAGNIGSYIVDQLIDLGNLVVIVDNLYNGKLQNIERHLESGKAEFSNTDIGDYKKLREVFTKFKPRYVSHQASLMIMDSKKLPFLAIDTNIKGTFNVIQCCIESGVKKITFASSASVFGNPRYLPVDERHPFDNVTLYGATKIANEALFNSWACTHNLPFAGFRCFNTYSERQGRGAFYTQVFQKWIHNIRENKPIKIYGDGNQTMDLVHAEDAARANILAMFRDDVKNEYFNVGTGIETSLNRLGDMLFNIMGKTVPVERIPYDEHLVRRRRCSIKKAKKVLGFEPKIMLDEGIRRYVDALR